MFILQKRAIRVISLSKYNIHSMPIFKQLKLFTLSDQFHLECCKVFAEYSSTYSLISTPDPYITTNTLDIQPPVKNKHDEQLISYKVAESCNSLPNSIKEFHHQAVCCVIR
jgi:hypothetical protein